MLKLMRARAGRAVTAMIVLSLCLFGAQPATAGAQQERAGTADRVVAQTKAGQLASRVVGTTANGRKVGGAFVPLKFVKRDGRIFVRGLVQGVVHETNGDRTRFAAMKTARLKSVNGTPVRVGSKAAERATCDVLNLVLGPLDLDGAPEPRRRDMALAPPHHVQLGRRSAALPCRLERREEPRFQLAHAIIDDATNVQRVAHLPVQRLEDGPLEAIGVGTRAGHQPGSARAVEADRDPGLPGDGSQLRHGRTGPASDGEGHERVREQRETCGA